MYKYDAKSLKAEEFINNEEILETLAYAEENKNNPELIKTILDKARPVKKDKAMSVKVLPIGRHLYF